MKIFPLGMKMFIEMHAGRFYRKSLELLPLNSIPQLHFDLITGS